MSDKVYRFTLRVTKPRAGLTSQIAKLTVIAYNEPGAIKEARKVLPDWETYEVEMVCPLSYGGDE